ncbi:MAG: imidazoleglycerol-phosphate dehydratase [Nitrososphaerota archaeon]
MRTATINRKTNETEIEVHLNIDGEGSFIGSTGIKFLDHLLSLFAYHSLSNITVRALWDLTHHGVEDVAITLGNAIGKALGTRGSIKRFGYAIIPMDEALAEASVDLISRSHSAIQLQLQGRDVEGMKAEDINHFFATLASSIPAVIHIHVKYGLNDHHKVEAAVKALAVALREAWRIDPERRGSSSSKGVM